MAFKKVSVIGSGSWGTALAHVFRESSHEVCIWGRDSEVLKAIAQYHENPKYLPGILLAEGIKAQSSLEEAIKSADLIVCAIPTQNIRKVFSPHAALLKDKKILNASKGIEIGTDLRVSQIFKEIAPTVTYAILSGPSFAEETVRRLPTAVTLASEDKEWAKVIQKQLSTPYFRTYTSTDVVGVETAGALKNVIAIAAGIVNGLKLGYNAQAALINRGMAEIARLGEVMGADPITFLGLSGMGDLVLTCTGPLSRNRKLGALLGEGTKLWEAEKLLGGVAEGVYTTKSARELSKKTSTEMPILAEIYRVIYEGAPAQGAVAALMKRDLKQEW